MENTDIIPFKPTRHHYLNQLNAVVALGGGHGLGRLLSALSFKGTAYRHCCHYR